MMGRRSDQGSLFYQFRLDERVPKGHMVHLGTSRTSFRSRISAHGGQSIVCAMASLIEPSAGKTNDSPGARR